jgi:hypothetical protein
MSRVVLLHPLTLSQIHIVGIAEFTKEPIFSPWTIYFAQLAGKELATLESMWLNPALAQVMLTTRSLAPGISFNDCRDRLKSPECRGSLQ